MKTRVVQQKKHVNHGDVKLVSVNIRSLSKHYTDFLNEPKVQDSDVLLVQQTCLKADEDTARYHIANFENQFISKGNGKGLALYYKNKFKHISNVSEDGYQMSKLSSTEFDLISVYRSSDQRLKSQKEFARSLKSLINRPMQTIIMGDFNIDFNGDAKSSYILQDLLNFGLCQIIREPTHIEGGLIDHCYVSRNTLVQRLEVTQKSVYYTDHDIIEVLCKTVK